MNRPVDEALAVGILAAHARHNRAEEEPVTDQPTWTIRATRFTVSVLPEDNVNYRHYALTLEARPGDRWVIATGHGDYLNDRGEWSWGPYCSDGWIAAHWHSFGRAVELAKAAALDVEVGGRTARDVLAALEGAEQR